MEFKYKEFTFRAGDRIRCKIRGIDIVDAVLSFDSYRTGDNIHICHNIRDAAGSNCYNKYGYQHSYSVRGRQFVGDVAHSLTEDVTDLIPFEGAKPRFSIDDNISEFLKMINREDLRKLFISKIGLYDEYNRYFISEKEGFLILKTTPDPKAENPKKIKVLEIKFGRFIRVASQKLNISMTDGEIESLYNKWVSYQNKSLLKIQYLSGKDILLGYTKANHLENRDSSLYGSCMNDKHTFLDLYTKNDNVVKLAVMYIGDKIAVRTLIWTTITGTIVHDKIYSCKDWVSTAFNDLLKKENIKSISEHGSLTVKLDKWKFKYYPYLDSFIYMDKIEGTLTYLNGSNVYTLQNQNGSPQSIWLENELQ